MATGQLWLFPPAKPLVERFGEGFFRELPSRPGVYFFCGPPPLPRKGVHAAFRSDGSSYEEVLYIGRAKDLKKRLSSYRVANPERMPRRMIRLLNRVTRIVFDECATEAAAQHREELLICVLAPRFNRAGKVWAFP